MIKRMNEVLRLTLEDLGFTEVEDKESLDCFDATLADVEVYEKNWMAENSHEMLSYAYVMSTSPSKPDALFITDFDITEGEIEEKFEAEEPLEFSSWVIHHNISFDDNNIYLRGD